jgi:hypothetical protein
VPAREALGTPRDTRIEGGLSLADGRGAPGVPREAQLASRASIHSARAVDPKWRASP